MKGEEQKLVDFLQGFKNRFVIPVYQRCYAWKVANCKQFFNDLIKTAESGSSSHFFGSIVSVYNPEGKLQEFQIIDGQQRITTTTLLLLAMYNLIQEGKVKSEDEDLPVQIYTEYLASKYKQGDARIKLRLTPKDFEALKKLFENQGDFIEESNVTINYRYFYNELQNLSITLDELYEAIGCLEVISITLNPQYDDPQLVFESLNSTGLKLTEGDKIRNYVLMGLNQNAQKEYYENYWTKIESRTNGQIDLFIRDYLSVQTGRTPSFPQIYFVFKKYVEDRQIKPEPLLQELKRYASYYEKLLGNNVQDKRLKACIDRLNRQETTITRPFFIQVLKLEEEGIISSEETFEIFQITESYVFRRLICDFSTNVLNKVFLSLHREIVRYDKTTDNYLEKLKFAYTSKTGRALFPNDEEFAKAFSCKPIYEKMNSKNRIYILERLENFGTKEVINVYDLIANGDCSIEHIMPQTLTSSWKRDLGEDYAQIHANWLHRAANLTLTAYNSKYSNNSFVEKRDMENGFKSSGFKMNQFIAQKERWREEELKERDAALRERALKIWPRPESSFTADQIPTVESFSLSDESLDFRRKKIYKFAFRKIEYYVKSWSEMFEQVVRLLHAEDKSILRQITSTTNHWLNSYVSNSPSGLRESYEIDRDLYVEANTSTHRKLVILRRIVKCYDDITPDEISFYIKETKKKEEEVQA